MLLILLTYPVSTCTAERSFSSMKTLKTPLRITVSDERLNFLAILHIHKHSTRTVQYIDGVIRVESFEGSDVSPFACELSTMASPFLVFCHTFALT